MNQSNSSCAIAATHSRAEKELSSDPTEEQFLSNVPIRNPGEHDLLFGRGGGTNNHSGNIKFRRLVNEHKLRYLLCPKLEKPLVARDVVALWRALSPPGRFLSCPEMKRGPGSVKDCENEWFEVGDRKALAKASQCLRERTPNVAPFVQQLRLHQDAITENVVSIVQQHIALHNGNEEQANRDPERALGNSRDLERFTQQTLFNRQCIDSGEQQMFACCSSAPSCNEGHGLVAPAYSSYLVEDATYSSSAPAPAAEPCGNSGYSPCTPGAQRRISMPGMMMTSSVSSNNVTLSAQGAANAYRRAAAAGVALLPEEAAYLHAAETGTPVQAFTLEQTSNFLAARSISVGCSPSVYDADSPHVLSNTIVPPPLKHTDAAVPLSVSPVAPQSLVGAAYAAARHQGNFRMERLSQEHQLVHQEKLSKRKKSLASLKKQAAEIPRSKNIPKNTEATENEGADGSQENCRNGLASLQQTNTATSVIVPPHSAEAAPRPPRRNAAHPVMEKITRNPSGDLGNVGIVATSSKLASSKYIDQAGAPSSVDALTVNVLISAAALTTNRVDEIYQEQLRKYVTEVIVADPSLDDHTGSFEGSEIFSDLDSDDDTNWEKGYEELNRRRERRGLGGSVGGEQLTRGIDRHWSGISCLTEMSGVSLSSNLDRCVFSGQYFSTTSSYSSSVLDTPSTQNRITKGHDGSKTDGSEECPSRLMRDRPTGSNRSSMSEMTELSNFLDTLRLAVE
jgi:hypothetical protein